MIDSLSSKEPIHFKKDISGLKIYLGILQNILIIIDFEIINKSNQNCLIELNRLKYKTEKEISGILKRIEMIK